MAERERWPDTRKFSCVMSVAEPSVKQLLDPSPASFLPWAEVRHLLLQEPTTNITGLFFKLGTMAQGVRESPTEWYVRLRETIDPVARHHPNVEFLVLSAFAAGLHPRYQPHVGMQEYANARDMVRQCMVVDQKFRGQYPPAHANPKAPWGQYRPQPSSTGINRQWGESIFVNNFNVNSSHLLYEDILLRNKIKCRALVDTGSIACLIENSIVPRGAHTEVSTVRICGVAGTLCERPKKWKTRIQAEGMWYPVEFYVVPKLEIKIILGLDFLRSRGNYLHLKTAQISKVDTSQQIVSTHMIVNHEKPIETLKVQFPKVFAKSEFDIGSCTSTVHRIRTSGPPFKKSYRSVPQTLQPELEKQIKGMLQAGVIKESFSPYASPALLVPKKDGAYRLCVDYRQLNSMTLADAYPTPRPMEAVNKMKGAKIFSTLDLQAGYWQIPLDIRDAPKTAFTTPMGLYEFITMPFGLNTAPATFQRTMDMIFGNPAPSFMTVYMDDILVFSNSEQEHMKHLSVVLGKLQEAGLKLKQSKCHLFQKSVTYVGHDISEAGVQVAKDKFEKIRTFGRPMSGTGVRQFLGFVGYYRNHIRRFAEIAEPLLVLTRKHARFQWSEDCEEAFEALKSEMINSSALAFPDFQQQFHIKTDASDTAIGAVLEQFQDEEPVAVNFASRTLTTAERNYTTTEKEALAIVWAVKQFRDFIWGRHFIIWTDHHPLTYLSSLKDAHGRLTRWYLTLQEYDFEIKFIAGKLNKVADALSRPHPETEHEKLAAAITLQNADLMEEFQRETRRESRLTKNTQWLSKHRYDQKNDLLYRLLDTPEGEVVPQIYVPETLRARILRQMHDECGHFGGQKTFELIRDRFYWPGYELDTQKYVRECDICQRAADAPKRNPDLASMIPGRANELVEWDLTGPFREDDGSVWYILVIIDLFTKWVEVHPLEDITATSLVKCFTDEWVGRYGVPQQLHNDQGANFCSQEVDDMCRKLGIRHTRTTAYNPQGNGGVERFNRTLKDRLRRLAPTDSWRLKMGKMVAAYRMAPHSATGVSPFEAQFHRKPILPVDRMLPNRVREQVRVEPKIRRQIPTKAPWPKLQIRQRVLVRRNVCENKLAHHWDGPFTIIALPSKNVVRVADSDGNSWVVNRLKVKPYYSHTTQMSDESRKQQQVVGTEAPLERHPSKRKIHKPSHLKDFVLENEEDTASQDTIPMRMTQPMSPTCDIDFFYPSGNGMRDTGTATPTSSGREQDRETRR